jgi:hypothetical protein
MFRSKTIPLALAAGLALSGCSSMTPGAGWQTLIDGGRGMDNFVNLGGANWRSEADAIVADARTNTVGTNYLTTKNSYGDFEIVAEFWVSDDANSGIYVRCTEVRPMTDRTCYEANIFDKRADPSFATGAIVWLVQAPHPVPKTGGRWNTMHVVAKGKHMAVTLNGEKTAGSDQVREGAGVIGLQYAGGVVKFRKVQIRPL